MKNKTKIETVCRAELNETNEYGNKKTCDTQLDENNHGVFLKNPRGKDRFGNRLEERFETGCVRLTCPECGTYHHICNVCDGNGYFVGDDTGKRLACHNCRPQEAERQRRDPHF